MVWALDDKNQVSPRPVVLGDAVGNDYLIEKGLAPGDRIVVEGVIKVRPGMTVQVRGDAPQAAAPAGTDNAAPRHNAGKAASEEPRS